jgi:transcriptional regulator with XRE-family HTH domain
MEKLGAALGRAIAIERHLVNLSQEALASKCGRHVTYISQVERGIKSPTIRVLAEIAKALNTRPSDLLRRAENLTAAGEV